MPQAEQTCPICHNALDEHPVYMDGIPYCSDCMVVCSDCGRPIHRDDATSSIYNEDTFFCDNCSTICDRCGIHVAYEQSVEIYGGDDRVCQHCADEHYERCDRCDDLVDASEISTVFMHQGNENWDATYCEGCINNDDRIEEDGDGDYNIYLEEDRRMPEMPFGRNICWPIGAVRDDNRIFQDHLDLEKARKRCPQCMHNVEPCSNCLEIQAKAKKKEEISLWVYDTQLCNYHDQDHARFKNTILRLPHEHPYLHYGIELEVVFDDKANKAKTVHDFIVATKGLFVAEYDRSVDMIGNGAEFISRPLSYKAWTSPDIRKLLEKGMEVLKENGAQVNQPKGCGLHIHMSLLFFEHNTKKKKKEIKDDIDWFFQIYQEEIEKISGREYTQYCFSKKERLKDIMPAISRHNINLNLSIKRGNLPDSSRDHDNHHYAIVQTNKTIEIRTFKSTLDIDTIIATLQFCRAIAHAARNMKITSKTTFGDIISCKEGPELTELVTKLKLDTTKKFTNTLEV